MTNNTSATLIERGSHLRKILVKDILINPLAQRKLRPAWAAQIANEFDPEAFQPPHLSHRGDRYFCVDGQHTIAAFRIMGWEDQLVECWVYEGLTEAQEASLFLKLNKRKQIAKFESFTIAVEAGWETETDINRIVLAQGLKISHADGIGAVGALEDVYGHGPKTLARTLKIIRDSYGEAGFEANLMKGVGMVCARYNGEIDDPTLIAKLNAVRGGVNGLLSRAQATKRTIGKTLPHCVAATVVDVLNSGKGGKKLPDWWKS